MSEQEAIRRIPEDILNVVTILANTKMELSLAKWNDIANVLLGVSQDIGALIARAETAERRVAELEAEVDRFRRGWGPSTPTTHQKRHNDLWSARCYIDRAYECLIELNINNYTHDDVEEANSGTIEAFKHIVEGQRFINDKLVEISKDITGRPDEGMAALETEIASLRARLATYESAAVRELKTTTKCRAFIRELVSTHVPSVQSTVALLDDIDTLTARLAAETSEKERLRNALIATKGNLWAMGRRAGLASVYIASKCKEADAALAADNVNG